MLFTLACECDMTGSVNGTCQKYGGQCHCKAGVTGRTCDQCIAGFYNFTSQGCSGNLLHLNNQGFDANNNMILHEY